MADGQVTFQISVDAKDAKKSIDNIVKEFENAGVKVDKVADGMSADMTKSFSHAFDIERVKNFAINAAKAVANFAKEAVQAASDLAEVQNVVDVTFGQDAGIIDEWSKNAGKQFGLTETQAKRFTSTLGAMMKSAGLAGSEITKMSTDMAGLAADMASFYNLDFDTAFQKIRSGISGEVEPLKQLGINLSAANLEAFRLSKGLDKSYSSMSQGEQVVLRYQYLMQATADAQGDFERTSDGFANATRMLETNIAQLKTNVGTALLPIVNDVIGFVNDVFSALQVDLPKETVLDKIAAIDLKTADKIAEIQKTADEAQALVDVMDKISGKKLSADSLVTFVDSFKGALDDLSWPLTLAKSSDYAGTISAIADSLELKTGTKASDWSNLLNGVAGALADVKIEKNAAADAIKETKDAVENPDISTENLEAELKDVGDTITTAPAPPAQTGVAAVIEKVQEDADKDISTATLEGNIGKVSTAVAKAMPTDIPVIKVLDELEAGIRDAAVSFDMNAESFGSYMEAVAGWVGQLSSEDAKKWQTLVDALGTEGTEAMLENLAKANEAANNATAIINALNGYTGDPQGLKDAVASLADFAGVSADNSTAMSVWLDVCQKLVDTIPGLGEIIDTQTGEIKGGTNAINEYIDAWQEMQTLSILKAANEEKAAVVESNKKEVDELYKAVVLAAAELDRLKEKYEELGGDEMYNKISPNARFNLLPDSARELINAHSAVVAAEVALTSATEKYTKAAEEQAEAEAKVAEEQARVSDKYDETAQTLKMLTTEQENAASTAVNAMAPAIEQMISMWESARSSIASTVEGMFDGFDFKMPDLSKDAPTAESMTKSLKAQIDYMTEYTEMLEKLKQSGQLSPEFLSSLSSGSEEDYAYLKALSKASEEELTALNNSYAEAKTQREEFINSLTETTLEGDDTWNQLNETVSTGMDTLTTTLKESDAPAMAESTMQAILTAVQSRSAEIGAAIDEVIANWQKLEGLGFSGVSATKGAGKSNSTPGATGIDYVPFNGFLARLHEGETVLTREQSRAWRGMFNSSGQNASGLDYGALGGVIRDNAPKAGGDVYLDGRTVGRVVSARQGDNFRTLERSGWQG